MVIVDSSVWISLYRKREHEVSFLLQRLINHNKAAVCGPVWLEFIGGFKDSSQRRKYSNAMKHYPWIETTRNDYEVASEMLSTKPELGPGDVMIAAITTNNSYELLTLDKDFLKLKHFGLKVIGV